MEGLRHSPEGIQLGNVRVKFQACQRRMPAVWTERCFCRDLVASSPVLDLFEPLKSRKTAARP